ncbi:MAG: 2-amino-4-hydroxy-6-hydroxymethyldihydropteridine diphosphokinase [Saprospiraceae bacterium]|nr:2-amino-4-hydroxy-6-hydroxymethyldihydropteridine diphosphokinase [Saprospiraceae bacterium]
MNKEAYVLLGGNLGDRSQNLAQARALIGETCELCLSSKIYETEPWGVTDQPPFYNQALKLRTDLSAAELLDSLLEIELQIGRVRNKRWQPRLIDIDLLFFQNQVSTLDSLLLPHPLIPKRNFVLVPLLEIAPLFVHPLENKTIEELYLACRDTLDVVALEDGV